MILARHFYNGRLKPVRLIVLHCTVSPEYAGGAEAVARYFATTNVRASAHCVIDNDSVVDCVADTDTAFGAAGANSDGYHIEQVGFPDQTVDEWLDDFGLAMLPLVAHRVKEIAAKYDIPLRHLSVDEVADGVTKGLTDHATVSAAFPAVSTGHWDPGPNYPWGRLIALLESDEEDWLVSAEGDRIIGKVSDAIKVATGYTIDDSATGQKNVMQWDYDQANRIIATLEAGLSAIAAGIGPAVEAAVRKVFQDAADG